MVGVPSGHIIAYYQQPGTILLVIQGQLTLCALLAVDIVCISCSECYLLSGSTCGQVLGWDVSSLAAVSPPPLLSHTAHSDAVTGCR